MQMRCWIVVILGFFGVNLLAQQRQLDSLLRIEKNYQQEDTVRAKLLTDIARMYYSIDPNKGLIFADKAITLAEKFPEKKFLAGAQSVKGANKLTIADFAGALESYQNALSINETIGNLQGTGNNYNNIGLVYASIFDYPRALEYYQKTLSINERTGNKTGMANTLGNIGNIYNELRDYPNAISYYEQALKISESTSNLQGVAGNLVNLGNVYTNLPDLPKALAYKQKALKINEKIGNKSRIANNLGNIGNVYTELGDYAQALQYHQQALTIFENIDDKKGLAGNYTGMGNACFLQKNYALAAQYQFKAKDIAHQIGLLNTESDALHSLSQIYEATGKFDSAFSAYHDYVVLKDSVNNVEKQKEVTRKALRFEFSKTEESLKQQQLLTDVKLSQQILLATKQQQELLLKQNAVDLANQEKALQHLAYLKAQSDLQNEQTLTKAKEEQLVIAEKENSLQSAQVNLQQSQLQLKDTELRWQKTQKLIFLGVLGLLALLSFFIYRNFRIQQKSNQIISREKKKSDDLLLNILPVEVANELKENGHALAKQFDTVTVLFTDFVDFTKVSEHLSPQELVSELHYCFKAFDEITEKYGLEKIKTIGDAYMAVSGLPIAHPDHAVNAAKAALDIQAFVRQRQKNDTGAFDIRIGLNSGPVVAGIVGVKKFAYDIWGDTVNTAARMESSSEPGKINLSGGTYALIKDHFTCTSRGKVTAKNKGEIDMYFLEKF
jgi:adenylate cyclase